MFVRLVVQCQLCINGGGGGGGGVQLKKIRISNFRGAFVFFRIFS